MMRLDVLNASRLEPTQGPDDPMPAHSPRYLGARYADQATKDDGLTWRAIGLGGGGRSETRNPPPGGARSIDRKRAQHPPAKFFVFNHGNAASAKASWPVATSPA